MCRLTVLLIAALGLACAPDNDIVCSPAESTALQCLIGTTEQDEFFQSQFDFDRDGILTSADFARYIQTCRGDSNE